jgi:hypothetical protein
LAERSQELQQFQRGQNRLWSSLGARCVKVGIAIFGGIGRTDPPNSARWASRLDLLSPGKIALELIEVPTVARMKVCFGRTNPRHLGSPTKDLVERTHRELGGRFRGATRITVNEDRALKRFDLHPNRRGSPAGEPRQNHAGADRGQDRQLFRRGRHHPHRGRLSALMSKCQFVAVSSVGRRVTGV